MAVRPSIRVLLIAAMLALSAPACSEEFLDQLALVDEALRTNPSRALYQTLESCRKQRGFAVKLYNMGMVTRAERALDYCFDSLHIPRDAPADKVIAATREELETKASAEYHKAITLKPDLANGLAIYRECAACHEPEGWGRTSGSVPQIAGQHGQVVIKQLADFRSGNRDSAMMIPYATAESVGGAQGLADVAAYVESLEISIANGKGPGERLERGEALYAEHCQQCHGASGEGDDAQSVPRIQAQHYRYLLRQFQWIRDGKRRNANAEMVAQIEGFDDADVSAILDYVSRLQPVEELQAPEGWKNPDFN